MTPLNENASWLINVEHKDFITHYLTCYLLIWGAGGMNDYRTRIQQTILIVVIVTVKCTVLEVNETVYKSSAVFYLKKTTC